LTNFAEFLVYLGFFINEFHIYIIGKIAWQEYATLYIQFHHLNISGIKDLNDVDFVEESFDDNCKNINFSLNA
jgi:hypothetical protein